MLLDKADNQILNALDWIKMERKGKERERKKKLVKQVNEKNQ